MPGRTPRRFICRGQSRHVGIAALRLAHRPGAIARAAPSHVEHYEGTVVRARRHEFRHERRVFQAVCRRGVPAIGVIPVVAAVDRFRGQPRLGAHGAAERARRGHRRFARLALVEHDGRGVQAPVLQFHAAAAITDVEPQRRSAGIGLPVADGARAGLHSVPIRPSAARRQEVPRHQPLAHHPAPFQISVGPFPGVAQKSRSLWKIAPPAQLDARQASFGRTDADCRVGNGDLDILPLPPSACQHQVNSAPAAVAERHHARWLAQRIGHRRRRRPCRRLRRRARGCGCCAHAK